MVNNMKTIFLALISLILLGSGFVYAGTYLDSAHGNTTTGVDRTSTTQYTKGHCAHCHEQHASIARVEPTPNTGDAAGPDGFCLLAQNFDTSKTTQGTGYVQDDNACFYCHTSVDSLQSTDLTNNNFAATFSGDSIPFASGIMQAFNKTSYHNLYDVYQFITGNVGTNTFTDFPAGSNPCSGCHNIHIAKRNKADVDDPNDTAISKPSAHTTLWGDAGTEILSNYTASYQAPHYTFETNYEPDNTASEPGSGWGSNMPDYNTFCTDCHNSSSTIYSTTLGRNLKTVDWENEKHGKGNADTYILMDTPYTSGSGSLGYVLSCMDCHEPHGSPNVFLLRDYINGAQITPAITSYTDSDMEFVCNSCHKDDDEVDSYCSENQYYMIHHDATDGNDRVYDLGSCNFCHSPAFAPETRVVMFDGTNKPVEDIAEGDKVLSFDFKNNKTCGAEVVEVSSELTGNTLEINGLMTTSQQLFAVGMNRWVQAGDLNADDTVFRLAKQADGLEKIKLEKPVLSTHPGKLTVFHITVDRPNNFFVIGANGYKFLVHNGGGSDCTASRTPIACTNCHHHSSFVNDPDNALDKTPSYTPTERDTF